MRDVVGRGVERSLRCVGQIEPAVMTDSPPVADLGGVRLLEAGTVCHVREFGHLI